METAKTNAMTSDLLDETPDANDAKGYTCDATGVEIDGDKSDIHFRMVAGKPAYCGVYVYPLTSDGATMSATDARVLVRGYWYFPRNEYAVELAKRFRA